MAMAATPVGNGWPGKRGRARCTPSDVNGDLTLDALSESAPSMGTRVASAGLSLVFMPPWHAPRASGRKQRRCQWCHGAKMPRFPSHRRHHHTRGPPRGKVANAPEGRQTGRLVHCASPPLDARLPEGFPGVLGDSCGGVDHDDPQLRRERALGQLPRHAGRCRRAEGERLVRREARSVGCVFR